MTRLIIVRHAESAFNLQGRIQGHLDSELTPKGVRQARALERRIFKKFKIDRVYSSDLGRAYSTTLHITRRLHVAARRITRDPLLREINLGAWEGMTPEEVDRLYDKGFQRWLKGPSKCRIPRCEGVTAFRKRIISRVESIARTNRGKTVLIVTHGGAITSLLAGWLKADFDTLLLNLQIDNTSLTIAEATDKKVRLMTVNDATHLSPRDLK
jgi:broad specificity phosphatase PhoE